MLSTGQRICMFALSAVTVGYKKTPMKCIGNSWICITCFHKLKDILNSMDAWDAEVKFEKEMSKKMDEGLGF